MKLIVVGNGVIGMLSAIFAHRSGLVDEVEIIGPAGRPLSASVAAGAMINALAEVERVPDSQSAFQDLALEFGLRGGAGWKDYLRQSEKGLSCVTAEDTLVVLKKAAYEFERSNFMAVLEATEQENAGGLVPPSELDYLPAFRPNETEAVLRIRGEFAVDTARLFELLESDLSKAGIRQIGASVLSVNPETCQVVLSDGQVFTADRVLIAAGANSSTLLPAEAGVQEMLQGVGTALLTDKPVHSLPRLSEVVRSVNRGGAQCGIHIVPRLDGGMYLGAGNTVTRLDVPRLRFDTVRYLLETAETEFLGREISYLLAGSVQLGLRPRSLDGQPLIGPLENYPKIFVATATNRAGLTWSPEIALHFTDWLEKGLYPHAFAQWLPNREPVPWATSGEAIDFFARSRTGNALDHGLIENDFYSIREKREEFEVVASNLVADSTAKVGFVAPPDNWAAILA